jgi:hypothetical protein
MQRTPGANPTIVSYNARAVKFFNATSSLVRFENKNVFFCFEKCSSTAGIVVVNLKVVGLAPGQNSFLHFSQGGQMSF